MANIVNIKIDVREQKLIALCRELTDIPIDAVPLEIGDIIIEKSDSTPSVIIERKSLSDLASSIKDGRYEEQSHRLSNSTNHANHNIVYLVEGTMKSKVMGLPDETLYSAMFSLNYYKGFSVLRTFDLNETATVICNMAMKLKKEKTRLPYYSNVPVQLKEDEPVEKDYCSLVKSCKKENITVNNISEIILSQIPGISSITAIAIMKNFKNIAELLDALRENKSCLNDVTYTTEKGQVRRINKPAISNIIKYLI